MNQWIEVLSGKNTVDNLFFVLKNTGIFLDISGKDCFPSSSMNGRWDVVGETFWNLSVFSPTRKTAPLGHLSSLVELAAVALSP